MPNRRRRYRATPFDHGEPIRRLSAAPVAGVVLIAAALVAASYPLHTHAVTVDLPLLYDGAIGPLTPLGNRLSIDCSGQAFWNALAVDDNELRAVLAQTAQIDPQPALWFEPDGDAGYGRSAQVLAIIAGMGLTDRCFHFANTVAFRPEHGPTSTLPVRGGHRECIAYFPE